MPATTEPLVESIVLDELDQNGESVELSPAAVEALSATKLVEVRPEGGAFHRVLPRGPVGAVRVGGLQVEVRPKDKVGLSGLLFLLGYSRDPGFRLNLVAAEPDADLWPAIANSLAVTIERALRAGVLQGYTTRADALRTIRGRIRFGDQLSRRPGQLLPLEVTYDEYTVDIAENQLLLGALLLALRLPRLAEDLRRRLWHLAARLDGVSALHQGRVLPEWVPSRLNERYHAALRLAEVVLRHTAAEPGPGGIEVASFVVTMSTVFEDFVTTALSEALKGQQGTLNKQYAAYLTGEGDHRTGRQDDVKMACDLVHLSPTGRPDLIVDAKYKIASSSGAYANADHYQMLAYCTALGVRSAWLVYAGGSSIQPRHRRIKNTAFEIVEAPLDLSVPPHLLLEQVAVLAHSAWATRGTVG